MPAILEVRRYEEAKEQILGLVPSENPTVPPTPSPTAPSPSMVQINRWTPSPEDVPAVEPSVAPAPTAPPAPTPTVPPVSGPPLPPIYGPTVPPVEPIDPADYPPPKPPLINDPTVPPVEPIDPADYPPPTVPPVSGPTVPPLPEPTADPGVVNIERWTPSPEDVPPVEPTGPTVPTVPPQPEVPPVYVDPDSLPFNPGDTPQEIVNDLTHAAPVGTDAVDGVLDDVFVLPVGVGVGEVSAVWDEGKLKVTTVVDETPAEPVGDAAIRQEPQIEPEWDQQARACYSRKSNNTAWYDPCYQYATLARDGDPNRVSWTHHQYGTGKSKGIWRLSTLTAESDYRAGTAEQRWQDWSPKEDTKRDCKSFELGVQVNTVTFARQFQLCESWDIDKGSQVNFENEWDGNVWRKERTVAAMKTSSVANGERPKNISHYRYEAW